MSSSRQSGRSRRRETAPNLQPDAPESSTRATRSRTRASSEALMPPTRMSARATPLKPVTEESKTPNRDTPTPRSSSAAKVPPASSLTVTPRPRVRMSLTPHPRGALFKRKVKRLKDMSHECLEELIDVGAQFEPGSASALQAQRNWDALYANAHALLLHQDSLPFTPAWEIIEDLPHSVRDNINEDALAAALDQFALVTLVWVFLQPDEAAKLWPGKGKEKALDGSRNAIRYRNRVLYLAWKGFWDLLSTTMEEDEVLNQWLDLATVIYTTWMCPTIDTFSPQNANFPPPPDFKEMFGDVELPGTIMDRWRQMLSERKQAIQRHRHHKAPFIAYPDFRRDMVKFVERSIFSDPRSERGDERPDVVPALVTERDHRETSANSSSENGEAVATPRQRQPSHDDETSLRHDSPDLGDMTQEFDINMFAAIVAEMENGTESSSKDPASLEDVHVESSNLFEEVPIGSQFAQARGDTDNNIDPQSDSENSDSQDGELGHFLPSESQFNPSARDDAEPESDEDTTSERSQESDEDPINMMPSESQFAPRDDEESDQDNSGEDEDELAAMPPSESQFAPRPVDEDDEIDEDDEDEPAAMLPSESQFAPREADNVNDDEGEEDELSQESTDPYENVLPSESQFAPVDNEEEDDSGSDDRNENNERDELDPTPREPLFAPSYQDDDENSPPPPAPTADDDHESYKDDDEYYDEVYVEAEEKYSFYSDEEEPRDRDGPAYKGLKLVIPYKLELPSPERRSRTGSVEEESDEEDDEDADADVGSVGAALPAETQLALAPVEDELQLPTPPAEDPHEGFVQSSVGEDAVTVDPHPEAGPSGSQTQKQVTQPQTTRAPVPSSNGTSSQGPRPTANSIVTPAPPANQTAFFSQSRRRTLEGAEFATPSPDPENPEDPTALTPLPSTKRITGPRATPTPSRKPRTSQPRRREESPNVLVPYKRPILVREEEEEGEPLVDMLQQGDGYDEEEVQMEEARVTPRRQSQTRKVWSVERERFRLREEAFDASQDPFHAPIQQPRRASGTQRTQRRPSDPFMHDSNGRPFVDDPYMVVPEGYRKPASMLFGRHQDSKSIYCRRTGKRMWNAEDKLFLYREIQKVPMSELNPCATIEYLYGEFGVRSERLRLFNAQHLKDKMRTTVEARLNQRLPVVGRARHFLPPSHPRRKAYDIELDRAQDEEQERRNEALLIRIEEEERQEEERRRAIEEMEMEDDEEDDFEDARDEYDSADQVPRRAARNRKRVTKGKDRAPPRASDRREEPAVRRAPRINLRDTGNAVDSDFPPPFDINNPPLGNSSPWHSEQEHDSPPSQRLRAQDPPQRGASGGPHRGPQVMAFVEIPRLWRDQQPAKDALSNDSSESQSEYEDAIDGVSGSSVPLAGPSRPTVASTAAAPADADESDEGYVAPPPRSPIRRSHPSSEESDSPPPRSPIKRSRPRSEDSPPSKRTRGAERRSTIAATELGQRRSSKRIQANANMKTASIVRRQTDQHVYAKKVAEVDERSLHSDEDGDDEIGENEDNNEADDENEDERMDVDPKKPLFTQGPDDSEDDDNELGSYRSDKPALGSRVPNSMPDETQEAEPSAVTDSQFVRHEMIKRRVLGEDV